MEPWAASIIGALIGATMVALIAAFIPRNGKPMQNIEKALTNDMAHMAETLRRIDERAEQTNILLTKILATMERTQI